MTQTVSRLTFHSQEYSQSLTDLQVLDQACRNTLAPEGMKFMLAYAAGPPPLPSVQVNGAFVWLAHKIRAEYKHLLRLKKSKKRWRA